MATPIGTTMVTAISRRLILPKITDNIYGSNPLFFRWNRMHKIVEKGGTQIEIPLMYAKMAGSQWYKGYQVLNITPTDSVQNGALDWAQLEVAVTVDGLTLLRASSNEAIVDYIATQFKQAEMDIADQLGAGLFSDGIFNTLMTVGLYAIVDNGSVATSYAGISHSANSWWNCQIDSATTTMGTAALQTLYGNCTSGGRSPTLIVSNQTNYNRFYALNLASQQYPVQPGGRDQQMAQAGFETLVFNGTPWMVDSHCGNASTNLTAAQTAGPLFLNEEYFEYVVSERANVTMRDFQSPPNQDAMSALLLWAGQPTCANISRQGIMTALTG